MCTENEETVKNTKHRYMSQTRRSKARARVFFGTWTEDRLIVWTCARSEAEAAARAVAAKRNAARLHATERAFIPALAAPVLQTAAAQALALMSLCPMAWILLACLVALVGAFGASDWWPLAPRLHPSAAGRSGCAQPADAPVIVQRKAPASMSRPGATEIAPFATRSAPAAEPNEADLLPALGSGQEKLLSSTEVEGTLKDWPTDEQASLKEQMARSNPCRHPTTVSFVADASNQSSLQPPNSTYAGVCVENEAGNPLVGR